MDTPEIDRQQMEVDIACVGFGPAMGGFLTTLTQGMMKPDGTPVAESKAMPGMPPQVSCYERADDIGLGVSGVVTKGEAIEKSFPGQDLEQIPMTSKVTGEKIAYLLDPYGASRRGGVLRVADALLKPFCKKHQAYELPWIPGFLEKEPGYVFSMGQFCQWVGGQVMGTGMAQIWPGTPVSKVLIENDAVKGIRLIDQGVEKDGTPTGMFMPGMDVRADLTVVADGPVGAIGQQLDEHFKLPEGNHLRDWAVGMKFVIELDPENAEAMSLKPGTVLHTIGFPEPEIFGFFYVYPDNVVSCGVFVPSWFDNPARTAYRYLQHWIQHPYLGRYLKGGTLKSWGAKSIQESGIAGEPHLVGDGYARIGEGSGSTNVLTNSGVDEAWDTGTMLAEAVLDLLSQGKAFTKENLDETYVRRRRESSLQKELEKARRARDGFSVGVIRGFIGTGLAGLTGGRLFWPAKPRRPHERLPSLASYYKGKITSEEIETLRKESQAKGVAICDALMDKAGWPEIPFDGKLLVSQQDALLMGGKVQAPAGYADHVTFKDTSVCEACLEKVCIDGCSGQAIATNPGGGVPLFDNEKCIHCGACLWNCSKADPCNPELTNISFVAGAGGLHSAEN
jgi:electron-transferring-flavoprotein dehydrogenase